jgi:predicted CopG family antitoxin
MTTVHISEETHKELKKIKGSLMATNGKERSFDEVINELITFYKERTWKVPK